MVLSTVCRTLQKLKVTVTVTSTFLTKNNAQMAHDNPVKQDNPVKLEMAHSMHKLR